VVKIKNNNNWSKLIVVIKNNNLFMFVLIWKVVSLSTINQHSGKYILRYKYWLLFSSYFELQEACRERERNESSRKNSNK